MAVECRFAKEIPKHPSHVECSWLVEQVGHFVGVPLSYCSKCGGQPTLDSMKEGIRRAMRVRIVKRYDEKPGRYCTLSLEQAVMRSKELLGQNETADLLVAAVRKGLNLPEAERIARSVLPELIEGE